VTSECPEEDVVSGVDRVGHLMFRQRSNGRRELLEEGLAHIEYITSERSIALPTCGAKRRSRLLLERMLVAR
jgi:hypothetical protein